MSKQLAYRTALIGLLLGVSGIAVATDDQWFLGIGGGVSRLQPNAVQPGISVTENFGQSATLFAGRDFDSRSSAQVQLYSLGESTFNNGATASYVAGDASVVFRFFDSRDGRRNAVLGASVYGRFGFGFINRGSTLALEKDAPVYFGAGAGIETYFTPNLGVRLEAMYHETDTASATVSLVTRFGGSVRPAGMRAGPVSEKPGEVLTSAVQKPQARPVTTPEVMPLPTPVPVPATLPQTLPQTLPETLPEVPPGTVPEALPETYALPIPQSLPSPQALPAPLQPRQETPDTDLPNSWTDEFPDVEIMADTRENTGVAPAPLPSSAPVPAPSATPFAADGDQDGMKDALDQCSRPAKDYTVDATGCSSFSDIARLLIFDTGSASLTTTALRALDDLAESLRQYPAARIELIAHTDSSGSDQEQSSLTRQRLRSLGAYLVGQGISQDRLLLRSFGGTRPAYDNNTAQGRQRNNRIEIFENP